MATDFAHGWITVLIATADHVIVATDRTQGPGSAARWDGAGRALELRPGFVVAASGIWAAAGARIDAGQALRAAFCRGDTAQEFLQRYDTMQREVLEAFLTERYRADPGAVLRECFSPVTPPQALVVFELGAGRRRTTILEFTPRLTQDDELKLTPLVRVQEPLGTARFAAIGAAAPGLDLLDEQYLEHAMRGPRGPEYAACALVEQALARVSAAAGPPRLQVFQLPSAPAPAPAARLNTPADTRDAAAVEAFIIAEFMKLHPGALLMWLPRLFAEVTDMFQGRFPGLRGCSLRYHDFEHTLQVALCTALIFDGRHAARAVPKAGARAFELAISAALLHDAGYLVAEADTQGTGAKYTYCHVLRSCAFAASRLPVLGASAADVDAVVAAITCTNPAPSAGRMAFRTPVDEVIACSVAAADFISQMAAPDYPAKLAFLFEEFRESDDFVHTPPHLRMFACAADLLAKTPSFWRRFVLPTLQDELHGVHHFLAQSSSGTGYLPAIEANIAQIERGLQQQADAVPRLQPDLRPADSTADALSHHAGV